MQYSEDARLQLAVSDLYLTYGNLTISRCIVALLKPFNNTSTVFIVSSGVNHWSSPLQSVTTQKKKKKKENMLQFPSFYHLFHGLIGEMLTNTYLTKQVQAERAAPTGGNGST